MDPIIRAAPVSAVPRQLRRVSAVAPLAAVAPAPVLDAATPMVPTTALLAARVAASETPADTRLQQRDAEIAGLRAELDSAAASRTEAFADAERRGLAAGEKKGLEQGMAQGERSAREQLQAQIERVQGVLTQVSQARRALMDDAEDALVEIAFAAVCRVLGEQGASQAGLQRIVRQSIEASREREQLVVRLHPDDAALLDGPGGGADVRYRADHSVALGGCMIDAASGSLDARFETQIALLADALRTARVERRASQEGL